MTSCTCRFVNDLELGAQRRPDPNCPIHGDGGDRTAVGIYAAVVIGVVLLFVLIVLTSAGVWR